MLESGKLTSNERLNLDTSEFGLLDKRKFPLNDEKHIRLAVKFFNYVDKQDEEELARNILKKMGEYGIKIGNIDDDNRFKKYLNGNKILLDEEFNDNLIHAFYISESNLSKPIKKECYFSTIEEAIKDYLNNNFHNIGGMNKIKRKVFSYNQKKNTLKPIFIGSIFLFTYSNYNEYDWSWVIDYNPHYSKTNYIVLEDNSFDNFKKREKDILERYANKVDLCSHRIKIKCVNRLSVDNYGNTFMQIQPNEKINNLVKLENFITDDTYIVSDLHFGKEGNNIDKETIYFLNKTIKENDKLIILGDITYMKNLNVQYLENCIKSIKCKNKVLILGNHDILPLKYYYKFGFIAIYERFFFKYKNYVFSHQPTKSKEPKDINFHGHLHESNDYNSTLVKMNHLDRKINCFYKRFNKPLTIKGLICYVNL